MSKFLYSPEEPCLLACIHQPTRKQVPKKKEPEAAQHLNLCGKAAWDLLCNNKEIERKDFGSMDKDGNDKVDTFKPSMCWPPKCVKFEGTVLPYTYQGPPIFLVLTSIIQVTQTFSLYLTL